MLYNRFRGSGGDDQDISFLKLSVKIIKLNIRNIVFLSNFFSNFCSPVGDFYFWLVNVFYKVFYGILPDFTNAQKQNILV